MADDEGYSWLGPILKYVVLPLVGIGLIWYVVQRFFLGGDPFADAKKQLADMMDDYEMEYRGFLENDGTIDQNEKEILLAKQETMEIIVQGTANAIPNVNEVIIKIAALIIGALVLTSIYKGGGAKLRAFFEELFRRQGRAASEIDPNVPSGSTWDVTVSFATAEELAMISRMAGIMTLADQGQIALASNALMAEQANYVSQVVPSMQMHVNYLQVLIPTLQGVQLAMAQYSLAQYMYYLTYYALSPPPLLTWMPPLI